MLVCLEVATGKTIWGYNIVDRFHGQVPHWGISESPLVDGNRLIVTPGGRGAAVVALDKMNGKPLWQSQSDSAAYSSPMIYDAGGARRVVVFTADAAMGLDLASGNLQWRYEHVANGTANIATPDRPWRRDFPFIGLWHRMRAAEGRRAATRPRCTSIAICRIITALPCW